MSQCQFSSKINAHFTSNIYSAIITLFTGNLSKIPILITLQTLEFELYFKWTF